MKARAVFLDRDGTLIEDKDYLSHPKDVCLYPGVPLALRRLLEADFKLIMVTNQSGVGRGYFTLANVEKVHQYLANLFDAEGVRFEKIYVAPEAPDQPSRGRKPSPQFLFDAREEFDVDLGRSYMVGDKLIDLQCGWNAGVKASLLVRTGYGAQMETKQPTELKNAVVVNDMTAAADWILRDAQSA